MEEVQPSPTAKPRGGATIRGDEWGPHDSAPPKAAEDDQADPLSPSAAGVGTGDAEEATKSQPVNQQALKLPGSPAAGGVGDRLGDGIALAGSRSTPQLGRQPQGGPRGAGRKKPAFSKTPGRPDSDGMRDFTRYLAFRRGGGYELEPSQVPYDESNTTLSRSILQEAQEAKAHLPPLESGLKRQKRYDQDTIKAAQRLANALTGLGDPVLANQMRRLREY